MIRNFLNSQTKSVSSAALLLASSAFLSRLLGLFRDRLLAGHFGAGEELDIYFAAFRIPDFVYGLLIMGGISAVFLPVFAEVRQKSQEEGWKFVNNTLSVLALMLILLCGLLALTTPFFIRFVVPGFSEAHRDLAISLIRIMFLSPILLGISSVFSGVLQYFHRFLAYSLAPVLYNLGIIFGIIFFVEPFGLQGLAYGVILGAFLHMALQVLAAVYGGWRFHPIFLLKDAALVKLIRLAGPRIFGVSAYHINLIAITVIASTLGSGAIAVFNFSNNLQYLPIGLIGVSFATAAFPVFSRSWAAGDKMVFSKQFSSVFRQIFFFVLPTSLLMILLRAHIVRVVYGWGKFGWEDTRLVAASLGLFAVGIFAAALVPLLARALFALQDTKTPAIIALVAAAFNIILALMFVDQLSSSGIFRNFFGQLLRVADIDNIAVIGLPLAVSLAAILQAGLLAVVLRRKIDILDFREMTGAIAKMLIAGVALVIVTYALLQIGEPRLDTRTFWGIFWQGALAGAVGIGIYFAITFAFGLPEPRELTMLLKRSRPSIDL